MRFRKDFSLPHKIGMYILSLVILFAFQIVLLIFNKDLSFKDNIFNDWYYYTLLVLIIVGLFYYLRFIYLVKGIDTKIDEINEIENINFEYYSFFSTYILPLIFLDFSTPRNKVILLLLLTIMGIIYIKTNLFYTNPILSIFGFKLYSIQFASKKEKYILITLEKLNKNDYLAYKYLGDKIIFGRKNK